MKVYKHEEEVLDVLEEKGFDYLWQDADEPNDLFSN